MEKKTAEEILDKCIFEYYRPSFPSDERTKTVVGWAKAIIEERKAILLAMQEFSSQELTEYKAKLKERLRTDYDSRDLLSPQNVIELIDSL